MKVFSIVFTLLLANISFAQPTKVVNKIVAQVGDNIILLSDIESQLLQMEQGQVAVSKASECSILEQLMIQELLINQAMLDSLVVKDETVDYEMENRLRILESKMGGRDKLEAYYGKSTTQIKEEFRAKIKERLLAQEMESKIVADISVTPKEVAAYYNSLPKDSIPYINMKLSFQQIVQYPVITKDDKLRAFNQLVEIRKMILTQGKNFETMARIHSMDPGSASLGGKITATKGMMVPQFEEALFKLKVGEVSEIVETAYGYHIIKLVSRKGNDYTVLHILIIPEFNAESSNIASMKIDSCYAMLKENKITWDEAVLRFSNDDLTKQNRGIISNPISGDQLWDMEDLNEVDQQIYLLTDALNKGDITKPSMYVDIYDHKQGVRIVRLADRFPAHLANLTDDYALIKLAAENDKKQKTMDKWVGNKIGNAYIRVDKDYQSCDFRNNWTNSKAE
ncbi:MAG: peptidylprolyl isomerase [Flavobacteriales bacterium]